MKTIHHVGRRREWENRERRGEDKCKSGNGSEKKGGKLELEWHGSTNNDSIFLTENETLSTKNKKKRR
jgi:hypothetical protein